MNLEAFNRNPIPRRKTYRRLTDAVVLPEEELRRTMANLMALPEVRAATFTDKLRKLHALGKTKHLYEVYVVADHAVPNAEGLYPAWWTRTPHPDKFVIVESRAREGKAFNTEQIESWLDKLENK
jgi:hypothetical protein